MAFYWITRAQNTESSRKQILEVGNIGALRQLMENKSKQRQLFNRVLIWNDGRLAKRI